jgi:cytochrome P450
MLMDAKDEQTGEGMTDRQLRDEVMTMFLAGHETTANALSWAFYLLSQHPDAFARLRGEVAEVLGGRLPTMEDLPRLAYTQRVILEAMRIYPPVWVLVRRVETPEALGGFQLKRGDFVALSPYVTHRDPRFFPNPDAFDPDRFLPERQEALPRFAYFPFSGGPRQCIGNQFALMEAQLLLACITQRYQVEVVAGHPIEMNPTVTLRPRHGLKCRLKAMAAVA